MSILLSYSMSFDPAAHGWESYTDNGFIGLISPGGNARRTEPRHTHPWRSRSITTSEVLFMLQHSQTVRWADGLAVQQQETASDGAT
jgi:hypothetical protein